MGSIFDDEGETFVEFEGRRYCFSEGEFWEWDSKSKNWKVLDNVPDILEVVNDRVALLDGPDGHHFCNCPPIHVYRRGCYCGGL